MESTLLNSVLSLYHEDKWLEILELNKNSNNNDALNILWVWPNVENLIFINTTLKELGIDGVVSIGCGCGLLEWIIQKSTGLPINGLEINKEWWESKYSNPQFINLQYVDENENSLLQKQNHALLFCYFNNGHAFKEYIKLFGGNVVIIIGPAEGSGRHTDPRPFGTDFGSLEWKLYKHQEVKNTKDFIAFYKREIGL